MLDIARSMRWLTPLALLAGIVASSAQTPPPSPEARMAIATFAGGCFWCVEEAFEKVPGVISAVSGYTGGTVPNPTYEQVSKETTGHAEAVRVSYDPGKVSYEQLVDWFWRNIDPTQAEGQFCDFGSSYRSAIFVHDDGQRKVAEATKQALQALGPVQAVDRHRDRRGQRVLRGRGLSPGLLQEESQPVPLLQIQLRTGAAAGADLGQGHAAANAVAVSDPLGLTPFHYRPLAPRCQTQRV